MTTETDTLLTPEDLARICGVPTSTVYQWNHKRTGPRVMRIGKYCRYRREDVDAWLEERARDAA